MAAFAAELPENPAGTTLDELSEEDSLDINRGTVTTANGEINHNYGTVITNNSYLSYNYGVVTTNNDTIADNYAEGTVTTNNGSLSNNYGMLTTNESTGSLDTNIGTVAENKGTIYSNNGTVTKNSGTIECNYGTIAENTGTVEYNIGGTVTGGTVNNELSYFIDISGASLIDISCQSSCYYDMNGVWVAKNAAVTLAPMKGNEFDGVPTVSGGTLTDNGDGTYTLSNITEDLSVTAAFRFLPVSDVTLSSDIIFLGEYDLSEITEVVPGNALEDFVWDVIDAGETGAVIDDPSEGIIKTTAAGTVIIKVTVIDGLGESRPFMKEFTLTVKDSIPVIAEAFSAVQKALKGNDLAELDKAAEDFNKLLNIYNNLSEEQMTQLAEKMGYTSAEEAFITIFYDWIDTNVILTANDLMTACKEGGTEADKNLFLDFYKSVFLDPGEDAAATAGLIRKFLPEIDQLYKDLTEPGSSDNSSSDDNSSQGSGNEAPKAGDSSALVLWIALFILAAAGLGVTAWRKRQVN